MLHCNTSGFPDKEKLKFTVLVKNVWHFSSSLLIKSVFVLLCVNTHNLIKQTNHTSCLPNKTSKIYDKQESINPIQSLSHYWWPSHHGLKETNPCILDCIQLFLKVTLSATLVALLRSHLHKQHTVGFSRTFICILLSSVPLFSSWLYCQPQPTSPTWLRLGAGGGAHGAARHR